MTIQDFLNEHKDDFDVYEIRPDWNGYKVYSVWLKSNECACVGYPRYALEKDEIIRESTLDETISIMDSDLRDESD